MASVGVANVGRGVVEGVPQPGSAADPGAGTAVWAPPPASAPIVAENTRVVWRRILAFALDSTVEILISTLIRTGTRALGFVIAGVAGYALAAVLSLAYYGWFWTRERGATPGMRLLCVRVRPVAGTGSLSVRAALIRVTVLQLVLSALYLVADLVTPGRAPTAAFEVVTLTWIGVLVVSTARDRRRRGIHDHAAGTVVVADGPASFGRHVLAIALLVGGTALFLWMVIGLKLG